MTRVKFFLVLHSSGEEFQSVKSYINMWKLRSECFQEYKRSGLVLLQRVIVEEHSQHYCLWLPSFSLPLISFTVFGVKRWRYSFVNLNFMLFSFCYIFVCFFLFIFLTWESLHARLNSHYRVWSYKKKEHKMIKAYRKSLYKEPTVNSCLLILDLKALRS